MPAGKVAPFPKAGNAAPVSIGLKVAAPVAGGSKAKAVAPGAVAKPGAFGGRPRLFDATRFANATRDLALVPKARGRGTIPAIIFFATVGSLLLGAGIALVVVGEDNYIVDLMVFGGICLFMGVVIAVVGAFFVIRPILKERRRQALKMAMERAEQNPGPVNI